MINRLISPLIIATTLLSSFLISSTSSVAQSNRYNCVSKEGELVTTFQGKNQAIELINWQEVESLIDGDDIAKACLEFSSRLQRLMSNNNLGFIALGTLNNQYFLCTANQSGNCTGNNFGFLIMLKNKINTEDVLKHFFDNSLIENSQGNSQKKVVNLNQPSGTNPSQSSPNHDSESPSNTTATQPQPSIQYFCLNERGDKPVTVVDTKRGRIELIIWKSEFFSGTGYTPQRRCDQVTARFQQHSDAKTLRYISTGTMNRQPVICVAKNDAGDCRNDGLLITLQPQDNPNQVLRELFNLRERADSGGIYRSFGNEELKEVIIWDDFLERRLNHGQP
ncbi:hypothetical protein PCC7418_3454 [Halothece sp. PCC 7418]|uniref:COP23 domain-containing protein n=1 Tax=Halothece sp. (strain PCC 7418) TaxID=65093 RepID=UPI0002A0699A|nr:COP23 domain-containing protein [Halothece sp. PCC 7418]AFZ45568.1 hypothetical protein PCC7418_3454 [Halothece sp. PCC 7418]